MKIISGKYKGRLIKGHDIEGTRPTISRIKESLFAIIQFNIQNSICLDLFAGSGSLGLEALSMGAKKCYFVDVNKVSIEVLKNNISNLHIEEEYELIHNDYKKALQNFKNLNITFDIIFLDPPYKYHIINDIISYINDNNLLNKDGIIVCEYDSETIIDKYFLFKEKKYGDKKIKIYKN